MYLSSFISKGYPLCVMFTSSFLFHPPYNPFSSLTQSVALFPFLFLSLQVQKETHAGKYLFSVSLPLLLLLLFFSIIQSQWFHSLILLSHSFAAPSSPSLFFCSVPWVQVVEDDAAFDCCMAAGVPGAE